VAESGVSPIDTSGAGGRIAPSCGGTSQVTGDTPGGLFSSDTAYAFVDEATCYRPGSIGVQISNAAYTLTLAFSIDLQTGASSDSLLGPNTVTASVSMPTLPQHGYATTQGTVILVVAADPLAAIANPDGAVTGMVSGTVSFMQDGFSLSGSFQSPYCRQNACSSP
jgi:hypothetical protein